MNECKKARRSLGLTQVEMAFRLGVNQSTISKWESGDLRLRPRDVMALQHLSQPERASV